MTLNKGRKQRLRPHRSPTRTLFASSLDCTSAAQSTSNSALANYLKDRGCIVREQVRVLRRSGWQFPPLDDCRRDWERRFPGWPWRDPELNEWQAEEVDDDDDDFNDYAKVKGKSTRF